MNVEELLKKRTVLTDRFDTVKKQKEEVDKQSEDLNNELLRMQGEYRVINELIDDQDDPAKTIDAEESLKKEGKSGSK